MYVLYTILACKREFCSYRKRVYMIKLIKAFSFNQLKAKGCKISVKY